jgi:peptidoglycan/LPS O-acetylase OafA/YrhL
MSYVPMNDNPQEIQYRPEIDGLRAVAIVLVMLSHVQLLVSGRDYFQGGFIGVDVFFVISGYLIALILLKGLGNNSFRFASFYERRARRLLPALLAVIAVSFVFAWKYLFPREMTDFAWSALASVAYSSNFYFVSQGGYWAEPNLLRPLLHTWSLAVEEQFYVCVPILFFFTWKKIGKNLAPLFIFLTVASFLLAVLANGGHSDFAFYMISTRFWELGVGVLLAFAEINFGRKFPKWMENVFPLIGLSLILISACAFTESTPHPSFPTLLPVFGAAAIIWFSAGQSLISRLLGNRLFVSVGLISYSLYLWHYPIFAFGRMLVENPASIDKLCWMLLTFFLSILSYFLIERPFRDRKRVSTRVFLMGALFFSLMLSGLAIMTIKDKGLGGRFSPEKLKIIDGIRDVGGAQKYISEGFGSVRDQDFVEDGRLKVLLVGDSFAKDFYNMLNENGLTKEIQVKTEYIAVRCYNVLPSHVDLIGKGIQETGSSCLNSLRIGEDPLDSKIKKADAVILASLWNGSTKAYVGELQDYVKKLGVKSVLIVGTKKFEKITLDEIASLDVEEIAKLKKPGLEAAMRKYMALQDYDYYLDIDKIVCDDADLCPVTTPGAEIITFDTRHLTRAGAEYIGSLVKRDKVFNTFLTDALMRK